MYYSMAPRTPPGQAGLRGSFSDGWVVASLLACVLARSLLACLPPPVPPKVQQKRRRSDTSNMLKYASHLL